MSSLGIIGREQSLVDGLTKKIHRTVLKIGPSTDLRETRRGNAFEVALVDEDDKPTGHVIKITVELDRFDLNVLDGVPLSGPGR